MSNGLNTCGDKVGRADGESSDQIGNFGPNPAVQKHANRRHGLLYNGGDGRRSIRRSQFLYDSTESNAATTPRANLKGKTLFGSSQSMNVISNQLWGPGYDLDDPADYPHAWLKKHRSLRVPKVVVISLLPSWTLLWDTGSFVFPADVLNFIEPGLFSIYSYFEQYNTSGGPYPSVRFHQNVGNVQNPWFQLYQQSLGAALQAKRMLESDENDPIYVVIPGWLPDSLTMKLGHNHFPSQIHNPANQGIATDITNASGIETCALETPADQPFLYPDKDAPANYSDFINNGIPAILGNGVKPHFGCNVLHLYWGHYAERIQPGNAPWFLESWPFSPEMNYFAPGNLSGNYLGNDVVPGFAGKRQVWFAHGLADGPVTGLYSGGMNFNGICRSNAGDFKSQFYEYRNFHTKLIVPSGSQSWNVGWNVGAIYADQMWCKSHGFWFGDWDWEGFEAAQTANGTGDNEDFYRVPIDTGPPHLKEYTSSFRIPDSPSIRKGIQVGTLIKQVVDGYYRNIDPGTNNFWNDMLNDTCLRDYGFELIGANDGAFMQDAGGIVDYVREHFSKVAPS